MNKYSVVLFSVKKQMFMFELEAEDPEDAIELAKARFPEETFAFEKVFAGYSLINRPCGGWPA